MASHRAKTPAQRQAAPERLVSTRYGIKISGVSLIAAATPVPTPRGTVARADPP